MRCYLVIDRHTQRISEQQMMLVLRVLRMESMDACKVALMEYAVSHTGSKNGAAAMLGVTRKTVFNNLRDTDA